MPLPQVKYRFYATLLDSYQNFLDTRKNYDKFYGGCRENPRYTEDEYADKCFNDLIDRINRVPFESEAADKGTAFNEIVDCLIAGKKQSNMLEFSEEDDYIFCKFKQWQFAFKRALCEEFAKYYEGAVSQLLIKAPMETKYGVVELYGYIDELMPFSVHDIKTTKYYEASKFKNHWQHYVYPYCLWWRSCNVQYFEYNITDFTDTYTESYAYVPERDNAILQAMCENFIEFLEANRKLITDKKIFNQL
ncbi:MAG: HNH endonuclease [Muribaculaceae bacterium]|nr:HNH endonuclease [Muribaculaceae bacterium]